MAKFIAVSSGKGGVGKTTTAINLGTAFSQFGRNVVVVDANLTTPNVNIHLGAPKVSTTLNDVLRGNKHITQAVYEHESGLRVIPASVSLEALKKVDVDRIKDVLLDLEHFYDLVVLDSSAGLGKESVISLQSADEVIIITNPELPAVTDALKAIKTAEKHKATVLGIVVSRVRGDRYEMSIPNVEAILEYPVIASIPEHEHVRESLHMKHPVVYTHPKSHVSKAYKKLAAKILGEIYEEGPVLVPESFFKKLVKGLFGVK